jgi:hypothetical protein
LLLCAKHLLFQARLGLSHPIREAAQKPCRAVMVARTMAARRISGGRSGRGPARSRPVGLVIFFIVLLFVLQLPPLPLP